MKRASIPLLIGLLLPLWMSPFPAGANAGSLQDIRARGEVRVGVPAYAPPFGFVDAHGKMRGLDIDIAKELAKALFGRSGSVELEPVGAANGIALLNAGEIDLLISTTEVTDLNRRLADLSNPYFASGNLILERQRERIRDLGGLAGKRVATLAGSAFETSSDRWAISATRVPFRSVAEAIEALKKKEVDAFVCDQAILVEVEKENKGLKVEAWDPFTLFRYGVAVRKGDRELLTFVNDALARLERPSSYTALLDKWFGRVRTFFYERSLYSSR
jgi:aspartate/glutamate/glutamine transport system substrate-binding protein